MQRLFSMFPAGPAGIALLLMRLASAAALLESGFRHPLFSTLVCSVLALALPGSALCLGFLTPYASAVSCLIEFTLLIRSGPQPELTLIITILNTAALSMLGPGAYSLDSRIFGRRIISVPLQDKSEIP